MDTFFVRPEKAMENLGSDSDDGDDGCNDDMLHEMFGSPYHLEHEVTVTTDNNYILHMNGSRTSNTKVAVALSDQSCFVYDINNVKKLEELCGHKGPVSNVKFSPHDDSLVYSSSHDGTIKLWDMRLESKCVKEFKDDSEGPKMLKPLLDFDIFCNNNFLCGGTELIDDDAFILFWDVRSAKLLGGYWESHMGDITQIKCHPQKQDVLATGSTDGLINIFDISKYSEEDAIMHSLNTESSVEKISWLSLDRNDDIVSCITHSQDLQLWHHDDASPFMQFGRDSIRDLSKMKSRHGCFIVDVHKTNKPDELLLLAGERKCLRTLSVHNKKLKPLSNLMGNKQIVRASWYDINSEVLVTGGEGGILSIWKPQTYTEGNSISPLKMGPKKATKHHRKKPY